MMMERIENEVGYVGRDQIIKGFIVKFIRAKNGTLLNLETRLLSQKVKPGRIKAQ